MGVLMDALYVYYYKCYYNCPYSYHYNNHSYISHAYEYILYECQYSRMNIVILFTIMPPITALIMIHYVCYNKTHAYSLL